jgi:predicted dehydrogenase
VSCGIVGCGDVSSQYFQTLAATTIVDVTACADILPARAEAAAAAHGIPRAVSVDELFADPTIELVVNLTPPQSHAAVSLQAIRAGKSVYTEKPLAAGDQKGAELLEESEAHSVLVGCAPDTFLGPPAQTARRAIDQGRIGTPIAATAAMLAPGHERSCPTPEVFYRRGAGPLMDMGVYYLTMLVSMLGPVDSVCGMHDRFSPTRTVDVGPRARSTFQSEVPTHLAALLRFRQGTIATLVASFEVWATEVPHLEIYGTQGTLALPDPNFFAEPARLRPARGSAWIDLLDNPASPRGRGIGVIDMAHALRGLGGQRATGALGQHVLDVMLAVEEAGTLGVEQRPRSSCLRPLPLPYADGTTACPWCPAGGPIRERPHS